MSRIRLICLFLDSLGFRLFVLIDCGIPFLLICLFSALCVEISIGFVGLLR